MQQTLNPIYLRKGHTRPLCTHLQSIRVFRTVNIRTRPFDHILRDDKVRKTLFFLLFWASRAKITEADCSCAATMVSLCESGVLISEVMWVINRRLGGWIPQAVQ